MTHGPSLRSGRTALRAVPLVTALTVAGAAFAGPAGASAVVPAAAASGASATSAGLEVSSPDDVVLGAARSRLVFSSVRSRGTAARSFTLTNRGSAPLTVTGLSIGGTDAGSFTLPSTQPRSFVLGAGKSSSVKVFFTPTAATGCPTSANPSAIAGVERYAVLSVSTSDATTATAADLSGVNTCGNEGANEPVLSQVVHALGYTTQVGPTAADRRGLGPERVLATSDEVQAPSFVPASGSSPVRLTPVAHYSGRDTSASFAATGWYDQGAAVTTPCSSTAGCQQLFSFPGDTSTAYTQNQKLMPVPSGTTTFSPSGAFGVYNGDGSRIEFTDDGKDLALTSSGSAISPAHYLHGFRAYPAYGPGRVLIPHTWILGTDITRTPSLKNNDYQDVVLVLRNADLATPVGVQPGATASGANLTASGTVSSTCQVTGFSGVMPNTAGDQCNAANIAFSSQGLRLTSTPGEMGGSKNDQQDALYKTFDASRSPFVVRARVRGPLDYLNSNYQQTAVFFGPDQDNYVKVEAEHNGLSGADPHLTMFYEQGGNGGIVQTVSVPGLTSASTLDLIIKGDASAPDPTSSSSDPNKIRNYPLSKVTVAYSLNGGPTVNLGSPRYPSDVTRWFSTSARGGLLVSGGGSSTPITATFADFRIKAG